MSKEMLEEIVDTNVSIRTSLEYHLQYNHFPPVDLVFVDIALEAIACVNGDNCDTMITMPNGIKKSAGDIVDELHLEFYLEEGEDNYAGF